MIHDGRDHERRRQGAGTASSTRLDRHGGETHDENDKELKGQLMFPADPKNAKSDELGMVDEVTKRLKGLEEGIVDGDKKR